jgi:hypothetical protein
MLRIILELVPFGDESRARRIGVGHIANVSELSSQACDYRFEFEQEPWQGRTFGPYVGHITNWPRKDRSAWEIVHAALKIGMKETTPESITRRQSKILEDATKRGVKLKAALLRKAGGLLPAQDAARLVGISRRGLRAKRSLIAIQMGNGDNGYPAFQFENETILAGVAAVLEAINVEDPWMRLNFFFMRFDELDGGMPIDAIRNGSIEAVVLAAEHFGDHGAS